MPDVASLGSCSSDAQALQDVLQRTRPAWGQRDLAAAAEKLAQVGIFSAESLTKVREGEMVRDIESSLKSSSLKTFKNKHNIIFISLERGPETIIFGISVNNCADLTNNQPRRPSLRLFRDIVANSGKIK